MFFYDKWSRRVKNKKYFCAKMAFETQIVPGPDLIRPVVAAQELSLSCFLLFLFSEIREQLLQNYLCTAGRSRDLYAFTQVGQTPLPLSQPLCLLSPAGLTSSASRLPVSGHNPSFLFPHRWLSHQPVCPFSPSQEATLVHEESGRWRA
jgi:hypothetical protein